MVCGLRNKEIQRKLLTEEHNFDEALKNALGAGAVEKDVAALSQEDATPVNMLDSEGRQTYRPRRPRRPPGKGQGNKPHNQNQNNALLIKALVAEQQATYVLGANTVTIHVIPVCDRVISQIDV